jgi:Fe2+ or Zn2+ uptake regulation protein
MVRETPIRHKIVDFINNSTEPIDFIKINEYLNNNGIDANKTTIYRQLNSLVEDNDINEIDFGEGKKRYESRRGHHHHLYCTKCKKAFCININDNFSKEEAIIYQKNNFKVLGHTLEFFGICQNCQNKISNNSDKESSK